MLINSDKYNIYFMSNIDKWLKNLKEIKKYIDDNNKLPSSSKLSLNKNKLRLWLTHQIINYKKKKYGMKNKKKYDEWTKFINDNKYKQFFN